MGNDTLRGIRDSKIVELLLEACDNIRQQGGALKNILRRIRQIGKELEQLEAQIGQVKDQIGLLWHSVDGLKERK